MTVPSRSDDFQLGTEKAVRSLLRRIRRPSELATCPLAASLCAIFGEGNPARALRALVNEALPGHTHAEARLRHVVLSMGFDDKLSAREAALEARVSLRHMQRFRAEAISAIAFHLRNRMTVQPSAGAAAERQSGSRNAFSPAPSGRPTSWTPRFRSEVAAYDRAAERSDALEMRAIAANIIRIADRCAMPFALRRQSEAALRLGEAAVATQGSVEAAALARERGDSNELTMTSLLHAYKDAFHENRALAEETAHKVLRACQPPSRDWFLAEMLIADMRITRGLSWDVPEAATAVPQGSHAGIALAIMRARQAALGARWEEALELASAAHAKAEGSEFDGLSARAAAVLSKSHRALGDEEQSMAFKVQAIAKVLTTQDYLVACDLFLDFPAGSMTQIDDPPIDALFERIMLIVPQLYNDSPDQRGAVRNLLKEVIARALDRFQSRRSLDKASARVRDMNSAFAQYALPANRAIEDAINLALIALGGRRFWRGQNVVLRTALEASLEPFSGCHPQGLPVPARRGGVA